MEHVRLAWIYVREHPLIEAIEGFIYVVSRSKRL
jgi:hypothetical protein